ncbi:MAG: HNH endonuclease [Pirellula sp.]|nr:HNH endonuclease [Pirellula sp.]
MPQDRPAIPAEIERAILIEAGHRCAVCGDSCPLERAHIIPWNKSREHRFEDLICLCAGCHSRADGEKWGERTLRLYKEEPWILRKNLKPDAIANRQRVTMRFDLSFENFDDAQQRLVVFGLASFLGIKPDEVKIVEVEPGSVIMTLELPEASATQLLNLIRTGQLDFSQKELSSAIRELEIAVARSDRDKQLFDARMESEKQTLQARIKYRTELFVIEQRLRFAETTNRIFESFLKTRIDEFDAKKFAKLPDEVSTGTLSLNNVDEQSLMFRESTLTGANFGDLPVKIVWGDGSNTQLTMTGGGDNDNLAIEGNVRFEGVSDTTLKYQDEAGDKLAAEMRVFNSIATALKSKRDLSLATPLRRNLVLKTSEVLFGVTPTWTAFYKETLGADGLVRAMFPEKNELEEFQKSDEYSKVLKMLTVLRSRDLPEIGPGELQRMITIRVPKSMHDVICDEANALDISVNKLCVSKLLTNVDLRTIPSKTVKLRGRKADSVEKPLETFAELLQFMRNDRNETVEEVTRKVEFTDSSNQDAT